MAKGDPDKRSRAKWPKLYRDVFAEAERQGWTITYTKAGHFRLRGPGGKGLVFAGSTVTAPPARKKVIASLRREGFSWPR